MKKAIGTILAASIAANTLSYASMSTTHYTAMAAEMDVPAAETETHDAQMENNTNHQNVQPSENGKVDASTQTPNGHVDEDTEAKPSDSAHQQTPDKTSDIQVQAQEKPMPFLIYKNNSNEASMMDQYIEHPAKLIYNKDRIEAEFTLKNASWWKTFDVYDDKQQLKVYTVSEDTNKDTRVVRVEVKPNMQMFQLKVHIIVPGIQYDHTYTTQLMFAEAIPKTFSNKKVPNTIPSNTNHTNQPSDEETPVKPNPSPQQKDDQTTRKQTQTHDEQGQAVTAKDENSGQNTTSSSKKQSSSQSSSSDGATSQNATTANTTVGPSGSPAQGGTPSSTSLSGDRAKDRSSASDKDEKAKSKKSLAFDRNADKIHRTSNPATGKPESNTKDIIYLSIIMVLSVLLLVGTYLYNKKGQGEQK